MADSINSEVAQDLTNQVGNRVIKFRAWDNMLKKWATVEQTSNCLKYVNMYSAPESFILMQFINLKDKNEVEIYEGDIVNVPYGRHKYNGNEECYDDTILDTIPCQILFNEWHGFYPKPLIGKKSLRKRLGKRVSLWGIVNDEEVIGNIYENPELLK